MGGLTYIVGDMTESLVGAIRDRDRTAAEEALRHIVGARLPVRELAQLSGQRFRDVGFTHTAWRWVEAKGTVVLVVGLPSWEKILVELKVIYPGMTKTPRLIFRLETEDPHLLPLVLEQAMRQWRRFRH